MDWVKRQIKEATKRAKQRAGAGWSLLGVELRQALICQEVLSTISGQDTEVCTPAKMQRMIDLAFAGITVEVA